MESKANTASRQAIAFFRLCPRSSRDDTRPAGRAVKGPILCAAKGGGHATKSKRALRRMRGALVSRRRCAPLDYAVGRLRAVRELDDVDRAGGILENQHARPNPAAQRAKRFGN